MSMTMYVIQRLKDRKYATCSFGWGRTLRNARLWATRELAELELEPGEIVVEVQMK